MTITNGQAAKFLLDFSVRLHEATFVDRLQRVDRLKRGLGDGRRTQKPVGRVAAYLDRLDHLEEAILSPEDPRVRERNTNFLKNRLKRSLYESLVIDKIPDSYFEKHSYEDEDVLADRIREDQRASLDRWVDHLVSESTDYPPWFTYWILSSIHQLGHYQNGTFNKRSNSTVHPFAELNPQALAKTRDIVTQNIQNNIKSPNFKKIYESQLAELLPSENQELQQTKGEWVKYANKSEDAGKLVESLNGHNTGWCIAEEHTAKDYLKRSEIHVFYSLDDQNNPTIPRATIVLSQNNEIINEIRGISEGQHLDIHITDLVEEKLTEFPNLLEHEEALKNMKRIKRIYDKHRTQEYLTDEDLIFLYQVKQRIKTFGEEEHIDPLVREIIKNRRQGEDLKRAYASIFPDFFSNPTFFEGDLDLRGATNLQEGGFTFPKHIEGNIYLNNLVDAENTTFPETVSGGFIAPELEKAENTKFPQTVGRNFFTPSLKYIENTIFPETIGGDMDVTSLTSAENVKFPKKVGGNVRLSLLEKAKNTEFPETVCGSFYSPRLASAENVKFPKKVGKMFQVAFRVASPVRHYENIQLPETVNGKPPGYFIFS